MPNVVIEAQAAGLGCFVADTVTKQADVAGLVKFLPIDDAGAWAQAMVPASSHAVRPDTRDIMSAAGYDVSRAADEFVGLVYSVD